MLIETTPGLAIRIARQEDSTICGKICYEAFAAINSLHGFPCDFPGPEAAVGLMAMMFSSPGLYCVVAESEGRILGSNCLDERSAICGVGPLTVGPGAQNQGVGRKLMLAVLERAQERGAAGVRLVQAAFHNRSLSLYASLGFEVREPLVCMQGRTAEPSIPGCTVRPAMPDDEEACNQLSRKVHGFDRSAELAQAIQHGTAKVTERAGRITAYTTNLAFFGHTTAETNLDLEALIAAAESFPGSGILVPSRNSGLLQWCLRNGLRVVQPLTLMSAGLYSEPAGAWLPSIIF
jgi:GNAT superfamily N-acetyltransferase